MPNVTCVYIFLGCGVQVVAVVVVVVRPPRHFSIVVRASGYDNVYLESSQIGLAVGNNIGSRRLCWGPIPLHSTANNMSLNGFYVRRRRRHRKTCVSVCNTLLFSAEEVVVVVVVAFMLGVVTPLTM